jgi:AcrR family transcriptional regulator
MVARELGVTKAALYRHFSGKEALRDAMYGQFFDQYAEALRIAFDRAGEAPEGIDRCLAMVRFITEYYARNREHFIFSLIEVLGKKEPCHNMVEQMNRRGASLGRMKNYIPGGNEFPSVVQMASVTAIFRTALFHRVRAKAGFPAEQGEIGEFIAAVEAQLSSGLGFNREDIDSLDYECLEAVMGEEPHEDDGLLKAVAGAVAEAGPWNASMDMVARRSGLSKSGLYAHFKSKQDMLGQLFMTELDRITRRVDLYARMSTVPAERLYLVVWSIADYLRSRPEILITLDWIRIRRMDIRITVPRFIRDIFAGLKLQGAGGDISPELISRWILFLIVNILTRRPDGMDFAEIPNRSIRILYRFVALGIKGW